MNPVERIKSGKNKSIIHRATSHENRLKLHSEPELERSSTTATERFLEWAKTLIPLEKYRIFLSLFQFPVLTVELVDSIYTELSRVFHGRNRFSSFEFTDPLLEDDWNWYKDEAIELDKFMRTEGWQAAQTGINSLIVVDLPEEQNGNLPEPYFYLLPMGDVIAFDYDRNKKKIRWVAFKQDEERIAYIDEERYAVYNVTQDVYTAERDNMHGLNYCPVSFFWQDPISTKTPELKEAPISKHLSKLDWLLFFETSKHHLDLYAPYPIYSAYEQDCDFTDPQTGEYCDAGHLKSSDGAYSMVRHFEGAGGEFKIVKQCPVCRENSPVGVGSFISVPQPQMDGVDMRNPVQITTIDSGSLEYNVKEVVRLKEEIYLKTVGLGGEASREALNEKQVQAGFESKQSVLKNLKKNLEQAESFIVETACKLRYGEGFINVSIDYGTEFYVYNVKELYDQYKTAKATGLGDLVLDNIMDKINETEHLNNPVEAQRNTLLRHLEPYRHMTTSEVSNYYQKGIITDIKLLIIKLNFSNFVMRFERENGNVLEFGTQLEFDKKIEVIHSKFLEYASEQITTVEGSPEAGAEGGNSQND